MFEMTFHVRLVMESRTRNYQVSTMTRTTRLHEAILGGVPRV